MLWSLRASAHIITDNLSPFLSKKGCSRKIDVGNDAQIAGVQKSAIRHHLKQGVDCRHVCSRGNSTEKRTLTTPVRVFHCASSIPKKGKSTVRLETSCGGLLPYLVCLWYACSPERVCDVPMRSCCDFNVNKPCFKVRQ